jgi:hypothetical protein
VPIVAAARARAAGGLTLRAPAFLGLFPVRLSLARRRLGDSAMQAGMLSAPCASARCDASRAAPLAARHAAAGVRLAAPAVRARRAAAACARAAPRQSG